MSAWSEDAARVKALIWTAYVELRAIAPLVDGTGESVKVEDMEAAIAPLAVLFPTSAVPSEYPGVWLGFVNSMVREPDADLAGAVASADVLLASYRERFGGGA